MTRSLLLCLTFAACAQPVEEPCLLRDSLTEDEANARVQRGTILLATTAECAEGECVRDRTVPTGKPGSAALGYCALPCARGCPPQTHCTDVGGLLLCLHDP